MLSNGNVSALMDSFQMGNNFVTRKQEGGNSGLALKELGSKKFSNGASPVNASDVSSKVLGSGGDVTGALRQLFL